ncbi:cupin-like domain-containing protein [Sphingomonas aerolata]
MAGGACGTNFQSRNWQSYYQVRWWTLGGRYGRAGPGAGRFFYNDDLSGFNFERAKAPIPTLVEQLIALQDVPGAPAIYAGAAAAGEFLPGWAEANVLPLPTPNAVPRVWIGNESRVSTHYDVSSNVAVVVAGSRRFCLFPPSRGRTCMSARST